MNKNHNIPDKIMSIRVPEPLFNKFKEECDLNFKSMSDAIRDFIKEYSGWKKDGKVINEN